MPGKDAEERDVEEAEAPAEPDGGTYPWNDPANAGLDEVAGVPVQIEEEEPAAKSDD